MLSAAMEGLGGIRDRIDDVDRKIVSLLAVRAGLVAEVVAFKRSHHMGVVDRQREEEMLARIGEVAEGEGLDPRVARQVLRTIIDSFTLLEAEAMEPD